MVKRVFYGEVKNPANRGLHDLTAHEAAVLVPLVALAVFMGVASPLFTRRIEPAVQGLVRHVQTHTRPPTSAEAPPPPPPPRGGGGRGAPLAAVPPRERDRAWGVLRAAALLGGRDDGARLEPRAHLALRRPRDHVRRPLRHGGAAPGPHREPGGGAQVFRHRGLLLRVLPLWHSTPLRCERQHLARPRGAGGRDAHAGGGHPRRARGGGGSPLVLPPRGGGAPP